MAGVSSDLFLPTEGTFFFVFATCCSHEISWARLQCIFVCIPLPMSACLVISKVKVCVPSV